LGHGASKSGDPSDTLRRRPCGHVLGVGFTVPFYSRQNSNR